MLRNDDFVEWMCYATDKDGQRRRFVLHGSVNDISERAAAVVAHEWPGGALQSVEHEEPS